MVFNLSSIDIDFASLELTLSPNELSNLTEDLNQTTIVDKLTQIIATLGVFICFFGILGNFLSIIVLSRKAMKKLSTYAYLLGLSVSDEISLIFTVIIWLQYAVPMMGFKPSITLINYHKILLIYVYPVVSSTQALSVWLTLAFTVDRYLYVCHPYFGRMYCTRKRAFGVIGALFVLAAVYSVPQFMERTYVSMNVLGEQHVFMTMTEFGRNHYFVYVYHLFIYCVFVVLIPMITIVILNAFLINDIVESNRRHRGLSLAPSSHAINNHLTSDTNKKSTWSKWMQPMSSLAEKCCSKKTTVASSSNKRDASSSNIDQPLCPPSTSQQQHQASNSTTTESCLLSVHTPSGVDHVNTGARTTTTTMKSEFSMATLNANAHDKTLRNDVTIMIVGLIVVFLICQLPSSVLRLLMFRNMGIVFNSAYVYSLDISNFLVVVNSTFNCILCVMLGRKFRREFILTFFGRFVKHMPTDNSTYYLNTIN